MGRGAIDMAKKPSGYTETGRCIGIMAGGTGGHIFPGLTVAKALEARGYEVFWLGAFGLEHELVPKENIPLYQLPIKGLRGNGLKGWLLLPWVLGRAIFKACKIFKAKKPSLIIGFGGYAAAPGGVAARLLKIPLIIHEQNAAAGLVNRWLAKISTKTLSGFNTNLPKAVVVGNPIRSELLNLPPYASRAKERRDKPLQILVLGGSQGARRLNELIIETIPCLEKPVEIYHQVGRALIIQYQEYQASEELSFYHPVAFIDDMKEAYAWADLVISRSGALTVSEILATGVASLFVPYPYAVDDHQTKNAEAVVNVGAAFLEQEANLTSKKLAEAINHFTREKAITMVEKRAPLVNLEATEKIVAIIDDILTE